MNIVPNLHSTLISVPKMADHGYIAVFDKGKAKIYDGTTNMIRKSGEPIIIAPQCENTGLWKMNIDLDYKIMGHESSDQFIGKCHFRFTQLPAIAHVFPCDSEISNKRIIHGCSQSRQLRGMAGTHNHPHLQTLPHFDKTQKGHMKEQRKGVRSTKVKPAIVAIRRKLNDIFVNSYELVETIHTNQTGAFPVTSQQGYRYIMVDIHIDANYIFCEMMKNRTEGEMISAYQKWWTGCN